MVRLARPHPEILDQGLIGLVAQINHPILGTLALMDKDLAAGRRSRAASFSRDTSSTRKPQRSISMTMARSRWWWATWRSLATSSFRRWRGNGALPLSALNNFFQVGFGDLAHGIPGQFPKDNGLLWNLVSGEAILPPGPQ